MTNRRTFLGGLLGLGLAGATAGKAEAAGNFFDFLKHNKAGHHQARHKLQAAHGAHHAKIATRHRTNGYKGATLVDYASAEKPGTLIIKTQERALYQILGGGKAKRYMVAVGKEGFAWSGVAKVGMKRENPTWTPPAEMIDRSPQYAKWADGMPGGLAINPLGPRAMYLFNRAGDTGFRIHGTIHPESIGHAASSGCIRMLNHEVIELYGKTPVGTKVIVI